MAEVKVGSGPYNGSETTALGFALYPVHYNYFFRFCTATAPKYAATSPDNANKAMSKTGKLPYFSGAINTAKIIAAINAKTTQHILLRLD